MLPVVYLTQTPYTPRDRKRYGIEILEGNGYTVDVWDMTSLFNPKQFPRSQFSQRSQVVHALSNLNKDIAIVCLVGYRPESLWLYRLLKGRKWGILEMNATPTHPKKDSLKNLLKRMMSISPSKIKHYVFPRIPYKLLGISAASFQVLGGSMTVHHSYPVDEKTVTLWSHHPDYDLAMEAMDSNESPIIQGTYCVFLDEFLPYHPDYYYNGEVPPYNADDYYQVLRNLFERIESNYLMKVVIALHPRAKMDDATKCFGRRTIHQGNTAKLVKDCQFVITHASNSINFAILFKKPIMLTITKEIENDPHEYGIVKWLSHWLDTTPIQIDRPFEFRLDLKVNDRIYYLFEESYILKTIRANLAGKVLMDWLIAKDGSPK